MKEQADPAGIANNNNSSFNNHNNTNANHNQHHQQQQQQYSHHHHSKDVNHSSDTEDCDLEGSGRLVIDLEAEPTTTTTTTKTIATTTTTEENKSTPQKSAEVQSFSNNSSNNIGGNNNALNTKKSNNVLKMSHSFSEINNSINNNNNNNSTSGRGRISYSISNLPGNNNNNSGYVTSPQVSYSTVSLTGQEPSANPSQQNKCIKMKIKRNTVAQGPHAPLSATSQLSATLHQQHSQNSPPPSSSASSLSSQQQQQTLGTTAAMPCSPASSLTTGSNGYQTKTAVVENSVFTYKIQHSSMNNSMTSVNSVTCKNVPLGSLPSLSTSEGARGLNHNQHHHHHHQAGGASYLSEGCQTSPYPTSGSGGMPTRSSKQPNNKRSKQSHSHNTTIYRDATNFNNNNNKAQNLIASATSLQQQHETSNASYSNNNNNNNSNKQSSLNNSVYSGIAHHTFAYDSSSCPKYSSRGSHKGSHVVMVNGREKTTTTPGDPYDFNCTTEDCTGAGVVLKKLKVDKCERACSPICSSRRDVEVEACHVGVITDPDCLGPCEPGTNVTLEGIVWNETENGLLVVNVTWRGKTYVGTLMDATRHHWAPPRFTGESPTSDLDGRAQKGRGKRGRNNPVVPPPPVRPDNGSDRKLRSNRNNGNNTKQVQTAPSPVRGTAGEFGSKKNRNDQSNDAMMSSSYSNNNNNIYRKTSTRSESRMSYLETPSQDDSMTSGTSSNYSNPTSVLIECPEENCNKKYRNSVGLKYHQTRCHQNKSTANVSTASSVGTTASDVSVVGEASVKTLNVKDVNSSNIKNDSQERNSISSEDGNLSSSSSSSSHSAQKHRPSKMNSALGGQLDRQTHSSIESAKKQTIDEPPASGSQTSAPSNSILPLMSLPSTTTSALTTAINNVISSSSSSSSSSSCVNCSPSDKTFATGVAEFSAIVTNGSTPDVAVKSESDVKGLPVNVNNNVNNNNHNINNNVNNNINTTNNNLNSNHINTTNNNNNSNHINNNNNNNNSNHINNNHNNANSNNNSATGNVSSNELKLHSISTMTHQTTETCPTERSSKRKKRERHPMVDRCDTSVTSADGCCAPNAKNPKMENDGKDNNAHQEKMCVESVNGFSSSPGTAISTSSSVTSSIASSCLAGNLYAGTIDRPIYISTSSEDCLTPFNTSVSLASTSTSTVIRSTSGLPSTSIYDVTRDTSMESSLTTSMTSENKVIYSTLASNSSSETPPSKQTSDKRHSPLTTTTPGEFPLHGCSSIISVDLNSTPEFTHTKKLRLSPADDNKSNTSGTPQQHKNPSSELNTIPQDAPSPAYSDISDANENAPMLEKEANQTSMNTEDDVSVLRCLSSEGPSTPLGGPKQMQDPYVCNTFYGLMPQLTPVVSSPVVVNREFSNKFSLVGNSSNQYGSEDATPSEKISPSVSESQKSDHKFVDSTSSSSSKKHDFPQSSHRSSSNQLISDTLRKTPSTSIMSNDIVPNQQVHLLTVPPIPTLGFPPNLFSGPYNFADRDMRAHWERLIEIQQKQYHDAELHKQDLEAKYRSENSLKSMVDERYKHAGLLPAPPSLISDYSKFKSKEDYTGTLNSVHWDGLKPQSRDLTDMRSTLQHVPSEHHNKSIPLEKFDRRYLPPPHMLDQPFQQSHQSSKAGSGEGGKPSAVVAPQTREKIGNGSQLPKGSYDIGSRENRILPQQQHSKYSSAVINNNSNNYSGAYVMKNVREGRQQLKEDNSTTSHKKMDEKSSGSSIPNSKTKVKSVSSDAGSSLQPTGLQLPPSPSPMPAPYPPPPSFYPPFLTPGAPYMPNPFDPSFLSSMNPMAALLQQPPYGMHPSQILHQAAAASGSLTNTSDQKSQAPGHQHHRTCLDFDSGAAHHKIHELKDVAKGEATPGNSGNSLENRPLSSGGMQHSSVIQSGNSSSVGREVVKDKDMPAEPTLQRHLHTHHHMHVINPYAYMNSESAMLASQPNNSTGVSPQLPRPSYLGK